MGNFFWWRYQEKLEVLASQDTRVQAFLTSLWLVNVQNKGVACTRGGRIRFYIIFEGFTFESVVPEKGMEFLFVRKNEFQIGNMSLLSAVDLTAEFTNLWKGISFEGLHFIPIMGRPKQWASSINFKTRKPGTHDHKNLKNQTSSILLQTKFHKEDQIGPSRKT